MPRLVAVEHGQEFARVGAREHRVSTSRDSASAVAGVHDGSRPAWTISMSPSTTTSGRRASQSTSASRSGAARIVVERVAAMRLAMPAAIVSRWKS